MNKNLLFVKSYGLVITHGWSITVTRNTKAFEDLGCCRTLAGLNDNE